MPYFLRSCRQFLCAYGPLAYLLKNRVYIGEIHHGGKWFNGEQKAILDPQTFERVQILLKTNANGNKIKHFESGALLQGKLYDDRGNLMGPSFPARTACAIVFMSARHYCGDGKQRQARSAASLRQRSRVPPPFSRIKYETVRLAVRLKSADRRGNI